MQPDSGFFRYTRILRPEMWEAFWGVFERQTPVGLDNNHDSDLEMSDRCAGVKKRRRQKE